MAEASSAENCTMPPSRPIEEPEPIEHSDEPSRARAGPSGMCPSPTLIASR
jgi:hypothetical protein